jgi:predicted RNA-binding protein associated with RNAse of E/G family
MIQIKDMNRSEWTRVTEKEQKTIPCACADHAGKISLLKIIRVNEPFAAAFEEETVLLADTGFTWLQLAMENDFVWFTVMFDPRDQFVQIYADLTDGNQTDSGNPVFRDLYLDFVVYKGKVKQLDLDELEEAYRRHEILEETYRKALENGKMLYEALCAHTEEIVSFFEELFFILKNEDLPKLQLPVLSFMNGEKKNG